MGKLLVSGNGRDFVKSTAHNWVVFIIIAIALIVIGFVLANQFGYQTVGGAIGQGIGGWLGVTAPQVRTGAYYIFALGGVGLAAILIGYGAIQDIYAGKTEIHVYENGIKGAGGGAKFAQSLEDTMTISTFQLEYDRVASVDVAHKKLLSINAFGKVYVVAVANPDEIVAAINERLRLSKANKQSE